MVGVLEAAEGSSWGWEIVGEVGWWPWSSSEGCLRLRERSLARRALRSVAAASRVVCEEDIFWVVGGYCSE